MDRVGHQARVVAGRLADHGARPRPRRGRVMVDQHLAGVAGMVTTAREVVAGDRGQARPSSRMARSTDARTGTARAYREGVGFAPCRPPSPYRRHPGSRDGSTRAHPKRRRHRSASVIGETGRTTRPTTETGEGRSSATRRCARPWTAWKRRAAAARATPRSRPSTTTSTAFSRTSSTAPVPHT